MNYETMDWELEAMRVVRAFGLKATCRFDGKFCEEFYNGVLPYSMLLHAPNGETLLREPDPSRMQFHCGYFPQICIFNFRSAPNDPNGRTNRIDIAYSGEATSHIGDAAHLPVLIKGLFHLGLLTPRVEAALNFRGTAHQKLEWALEYESKYGG